MDNKFIQETETETEKNKEFPFWSRFILFSVMFIAVKTIAAIFIVEVKPETEIAYVISAVISILFLAVICFYFRKKLYCFDSFLNKLKFILFNISVISLGGVVSSVYASMGYDLIILLPTVIIWSVFLIIVSRLIEIYHIICPDNDNLVTNYKLKYVIHFLKQLMFNRSFHKNPEVRYYYSSTMLFVFILILNYGFSQMNSINKVYLLTVFFAIVVVGYVLFNLFSNRKKQKILFSLKIILTYVALEIGIIFSPLVYIYDSCIYEYLFDKIYVSLCSSIVVIFFYICILLIVHKRRLSHK